MPGVAECGKPGGQGGRMSSQGLWAQEPKKPTVIDNGLNEGSMTSFLLQTLMGENPMLEAQRLATW